MTRNISEILRGGLVTRWHANPDMAHIRETLAEHHAKVAQILLALHPAPSLHLIDAALHHDAGEPHVGDVPWPCKRDNPSLAAALAAAEKIARLRLGCDHNLNASDTAWLKLADRLSGIDHVRRTNPAILSNSDWQGDIKHARELAEKLGADVSALLEGL